MASQADIAITRFCRYVALGETAPRARVIVPDAPRISYDLARREIYSYGRHFPLARFIPAKRGRRALWLINGDTWTRGWTATPRHQTAIRSAIADTIADAAKSGRVIESLIIPFSALDGAGIERDSVRPIHVRPDRTEEFKNIATAPRSLFARDVLSREQCEIDSRNKDAHSTAILGSQNLGTVTLAVRRESLSSGLVESFTRTAKVTRSITYLGYDYTANDRQGAYVEYNPAKLVTWLDSSDQVTITDVDTDTVSLSWASSRHWLGDSLFMADMVTTTTVPCPNHVETDISDTWCEACGHMLRGTGRITETKRRRMRFLSSFDYNERWPLYFLAALPAKSRAKSVDMAYDDLAPAAVHAAWARGLDVKRQGDIFFIPTPLTDTDIANRARRRTRLHMWTHGTGKPRKGELGYRAPMSDRHVAAWRRMRLNLARDTMRGHMLADRRPATPAGWHAKHRKECADILAELARHEARIAAGDNVCSCYDQGAYHAGKETCGNCKAPAYYRGYTVENAKRGAMQCGANLIEWSRKRRPRATGYCTEAAPSSKHGRCYDRANSAWRDATRMADAKYNPPIDTDGIRSCLAIHGTGHTATEVAVCAYGVTYCRGRVRHVPAIAGERRESDHAVLALDDGVWYLAIRNTVPRQ